MDEQDALPIFSQRVTQVRERRGLTQQELAANAGTTYQTIWRIERGLHKEPGIYLAARIAKTLNASLDFLVGIYDERDLLAAGLAMDGTWDQTGSTSLDVNTPRP